MRIILIITILLFGAYVGLFFYINNLVNGAIYRFSTDIIKAEVSVESTSFDFTNNKITLSGIKIASPNGFSGQDAFLAQELSVELNSFWSVLGSVVRIKEINVVGPSFSYEMLPDTSTNIGVLNDNADSYTPQRGKRVLIAKFHMDEAPVNTDLNFAIAEVKRKFTLPAIELKNIGGNEDGIGFGTAAKQIVNAVHKELTHDNIKNLTIDVITENAGAIKEKAQELWRKEQEAK